MTLVKDITSCDLSVVRGLEEEIIDEMNILVPNALVSIEDLNLQNNGSSVLPFVQPAAKDPLRRALNNRGTKLLVNSAYRTIAAQLLLFQQFQERRCNIGIAAPPGLSNHQSGLALDVEDSDNWQDFLEEQGWQRLLPNDPPHFDYIRGGTHDIRSTAVLAFQRLWNRNNPDRPIAEDGGYGPQTEEALLNSPADGFGERTRLLRVTEPLMQGKDVSKVQEALVKLNFNIKVDGIYGSVTETAVKQFQKDKGLVVDGIVGPGTLAALAL